MWLITFELSAFWGLDLYLYSALSVCFLVIVSAASPFLVLASLFLSLSLSRALFPSLFLVAVVFPFFLLPLCLFLLASLSVFPLFLVPSSQSVTAIGKKRKSTDSSVQLKSPCNVRLLSSNQKRSRTLWTVTSARRHQGYLPLPSNIPAANCWLTNLSQRNHLPEVTISLCHVAKHFT